MLAADQDYQRMCSPSSMWADEMDDDRPLSAEEIAECAAIRLMWQEEDREFANKAAENARLAEEEECSKAKEEEQYEAATAASELYWAIHHCGCTVEEIDAMPMGSTGCPCYQKIKLDENGEPQECRFFNSPCGCRDGDACFYKHVERDASEIPCRFEQSEVGCNPGFGRKCPYKHSKIQETINYSTIICRFDGHCHPREGTCPYKHTIMTNRIPRHPNGRSWRT